MEGIPIELDELYPSLVDAEGCQTTLDGRIIGEQCSVEELSFDIDFNADDIDLDVDKVAEQLEQDLHKSK
jgi:hypothetical protein